MDDIQCPFRVSMLHFSSPLFIRPNPKWLNSIRYFWKRNNSLHLIGHWTILNIVSQGIIKNWAALIIAVIIKTVNQKNVLGNKRVDIGHYLRWKFTILNIASRFCKKKCPLFSGEKTIKSLQSISTDTFEFYNICVNKWPYRLESR